MKKLLTYVLEKFDSTPKIEDIEECIKIAKTENCVVLLEWDRKWSGHYQRYIYADDDAQDVYDNRIPKIYGL